MIAKFSLLAALLFTSLGPVEFSHFALGVEQQSVAAVAAPVRMCRVVKVVYGREIVIGMKPCAISDVITDTGWYDQGRQVTAGVGPKLRYSVEYSRLCTAEEVALRNCRASSDSLCGAAVAPVSRMITALNGPRKGQRISTAVYCGEEPGIEVPGAEEDIAKVTPDEFRRMPIAASEIASQPDGFSLRNGHAHMYASSETQDFNITLFDQDVRVKAIPMSYVWTYGDGTSRTLDFPGEPRPNHNFEDETPSSHVYKETGDFTVGMSTRFRGEYSTEGGPWTPIPGVATVPSDSMVMSVWKTKKLLVSTDCVSNPSGPGCDSPFDD